MEFTVLYLWRTVIFMEYSYCCVCLRRGAVLGHAITHDDGVVSPNWCVAPDDTSNYVKQEIRTLEDLKGRRMQ